MTMRFALIWRIDNFLVLVLMDILVVDFSVQVNSLV